MKKEIWYEDQPVLKEDLNRAQATKEDAVTDRQKDSFSYGVVSDSQLLAESMPFQITINTTPFSATIGTGVSYSPVGERVLIPAALTYDNTLPSTMTDDGIGGTTLTPQSTGSVNVPLTSGQVNYIYISYLQTIDTAVFSLQNGTNKRLFTKADDGYRVDVVTDPGPAVGDPDTFKPNPNAIFLGVVNTSQVLSLTARPIFNLKQRNLLATVPDATTTLNALGKPYAVAQTVSHQDHVQAVGTGTVTARNPHGLSIADLTGSFAGKTAEQHEKLFHESGISGDQTTVASALYGAAVDSAGAPIAPTFARDNFLIKKLLATEAVQVNGITVSNTDIAEDFLFYFVDTVGNFLSNGTYTVYLDATSKSLRLAANGSPVNTAYRIYGVTTGTFTNLNTVAIATVLANPNNFLLWQVDWDSSGSGLGNDNFSNIVDKRFFGTIASQSLRRDSSTDTVSIAHNINLNAPGKSFKENGAAIVPVGSITMFGGVAAPTGWLECDGQSYSTATYPLLFAAIGYSWGGSGANFRVPDFRGVVPRGWSHTAADSYADPDAGSRAARYAGGNTGNNVGSYQLDRVGEHNHTITAGSASVSQNTDIISVPTPPATTNGVTNNPGGETRGKNAYVMFIIRGS